MSMTLLAPALLMGFLGSPHCMGMCGGIVAAFGISIKDSSPKKRALLIGTYHTGRLISYMALGVVATLFGEHILAPFLMGNALPRIVLGLAIVFAALLMLGVPFFNRLEKVGLGLWNALAPVRQKVLPMNSVPKALAAGLLWGLLPCGLVYGALVMAVSISATGQTSGLGVLFMLAFGVGTLPALVLSGVTLSWLQAKVKVFNLRKFSGAIMLVSGLFVMLSQPVMQYMHGHGEHGHHHHGHHHSAHHEQQNHAHHRHHHGH
ncbi:MAG: sulfite exporter TauE/SafE family protein [Moraxella sp.]|nr:sulfite exporter TauE/SafE family protein [Moraxella sp.]